MVGDANKDLSPGYGNEFPTFIATMPASAQQRRIAFGIIIVLSGVFAFVIPLRDCRADALMPSFPLCQTVLCFADLITAVLLFAQYSIQPQRALLALASGYIASGLFAFLQTLDFPGSYSATGLISGGPSGAPWLFSLWHIAFPLAVIAYGLLKDTDRTTSLALSLEPGRAIAVTVACVLVMTAGLTWLVAKDFLPPTFIDLTRQTPFVQYLAGAMWVLNATALVLLFLRMRTILDLWLTGNALCLFA